MDNEQIIHQLKKMRRKVTDMIHSNDNEKLVELYDCITQVMYSIEEENEV